MRWDKKKCFCVHSQNVCVFLRNFVFACKTFVIELTWGGGRKKDICLICKFLWKKCNTFVRESKYFASKSKVSWVNVVLLPENANFCKRMQCFLREMQYFCVRMQIYCEKTQCFLREIQYFGEKMKIFCKKCSTFARKCKHFVRKRKVPWEKCNTFARNANILEYDFFVMLD